MKKNTRLTCWSIPSDRITALYWCRAVAPDGWRALWLRFIRASGWLCVILTTGYLVTSYTYISGAGNNITVCVYNTLYGRVEVSQRKLFCPMVRSLDVE